MSMATDMVDAQIEAYRAKDVERFLSHYADDASVVLFDGTPMFADKQAIVLTSTGQPGNAERKLRRLLAALDGRLGARGPSGASVTHDAHISHSSAQPIPRPGRV